ncbi:hypothetical protein PMAA_061800 [Talaromyces marneffei ATCC 18224]|uniref:Uncharacterized protein n=2 Tax=Talaromyces marneffei TaxID=37727 RepID=B6QN97_TALMQ|nr:hypothetical protein PMAA_061800 [Talaromyces marneffei ATCC 18224]
MPSAPPELYISSRVRKSSLGLLDGQTTEIPPVLTLSKDGRPENPPQKYHSISPLSNSRTTRRKILWLTSPQQLSEPVNHNSLDPPTRRRLPWLPSSSPETQLTAASPPATPNGQSHTANVYSSQYGSQDQKRITCETVNERDAVRPRFSPDYASSESTHTIPDGFTLHLGDFAKNGPLAPYSNSKLSYYPSCREALEYLQTIHSEVRQKIHSVYIPDDLMAVDDADNVGYIEPLLSFLRTQFDLDHISLEVPNDLQFAHNEGIEDIVLPGYEEILRDIRCRSWKFPPAEKAPRWKEDVRDVWLQAGYHLDIDEQRKIGEGTVIRLRYV